MNILNINKSNQKFIEIIKTNKPFSVIRLGSNETYITVEYINNNKINEYYLHPFYKTLYNAGIYTNNKDINKIKLYCEYYHKAIQNSDILACILNLPMLTNIQNTFANMYQLSQIHSRSLEPFYAIMENQIPWTHYLLDKKILIINPFVDSFKKQLDNNFQIFKDPDKKIFLDEQQFVFYKSFNTIAGNHIHNDWFETYTIMCNDILKLDFDIALLGCGGYGLPLCNFIKTNMNKSAIYVGGGLQLLFGVMGKRWENIEMWKEIIKENDCKFIRPSGDEIILNNKSIERGCYW